jgi:hypothetical protein
MTERTVDAAAEAAAIEAALRAAGTPERAISEKAYLEFAGTPALPPDVRERLMAGYRDKRPVTLPGPG